VRVDVPPRVQELVEPTRERLSPRVNGTPAPPDPAAPSQAAHPSAGGAVSEPSSQGAEGGPTTGATPTKPLRPIEKAADERASKDEPSAGSHPAADAANSASRAGSTDPFGSEEEPALSRVVSTIVGVLPGWVKALLAALGLLALSFGAVWAVMHLRARRLRRQGSELSQDAGLLRQALAPREPGRLGSLEFSVAVRPAGRPPVGRGFHDVFALGSNRAGIVMGQVSSQGDAPLARAALVRHGLRAHLELGLPPRSALRRTGELRQDDRAGGFASGTVAVYDGARGTLTYACAGHPTPVIFGSGADRLSPIPHFSAPIGTGSECGQRQTVISLSPGSGACIYSDGVRWLPEQAAGIDRGAVGALEEDGMDASGLVEEITAGGGERSDDLLVCVLRPAIAGCAAATHIEELVLTPDDSEAAHRFLIACGLGPQAAAEVSGSAVERAGKTGRSVLRISWDADGPEHQVLPYRSDSEWPARPSLDAVAGM
jgi:hypothetical protein